MPIEADVEKLIEVVYQRFQSLQIEPLTPSRLESLVRSARRTYDIDFCQRTISKLSPSCRTAIDALLCTSCSTTTDSEGDSQAQASLFHYLNSSPGRVSLNSLLSEISKLQHLRRIELPDDLFTDISAQVLQTYAARAAMEYPSHLRAHPDPIRYTLVAAFCWLKSQEVTDNLVDLLIQMIHGLGTRATKKVDTELIQDLKRVTGKHNILYNLASVMMRKFPWKELSRVVGRKS